jgi:hypothetical protein
MSFKETFSKRLIVILAVIAILTAFGSVIAPIVMQVNNFPDDCIQGVILGGFIIIVLSIIFIVNLWENIKD